jgi:hypothetical protein
MVLADRLPVSGDFYEIVKPIEFREPKECLAVQKAFACLCGIELRDAIDRRLDKLGDKASEASREALYKGYLDGFNRLPLVCDLLSCYAGEAHASDAWSPDFRASLFDEGLAASLAEEIARLERTFFEMTEPPMPLSRALAEVISDDALLRYHMSAYGLDTEALVGQIESEPRALLALRYLPLAILKHVRSGLQMRSGSKPDHFVMQRYPGAHEEDVVVELLSILYTPEAFLFRTAIHELRRDAPAHLEGLRRFWNRELVARMGMERAIDIHFPRFRVLVKQAAARQALSPEVLAEIMLQFEGVSPLVISGLVECFDAVAGDRLVAILRQNFSAQPVIEEVYNLLYPEAQLRSSIAAMKVEPEFINEMLLHLDGFAAEAVARELHGVISSRSGAELGAELVALVSATDKEERNPRIPEDLNWQDEMMHQIGMAYERIYAKDIFDDCQKRQVPHGLMTEFVQRMIGREIFEAARSLYTLITKGREGLPESDGETEHLAIFLESRSTRYRERIVRAYSALWSLNAGGRDLRDDIRSFVKESEPKRKILALFGASR